MKWQNSCLGIVWKEGRVWNGSLLASALEINFPHRVLSYFSVALSLLNKGNNSKAEVERETDYLLLFLPFIYYGSKHFMVLYFGDDSRRSTTINTSFTKAVVAFILVCLNITTWMFSGINKKLTKILGVVEVSHSSGAYFYDVPFRSRTSCRGQRMPG